MALFALTGLAMAACAARLPQPQTVQAATDFRDTVPEPGPQPSFSAPAPTRTVLENGLQVFVLRKTELPLVHMALVVRSGSASDPTGQEGATALLAQAMKLGSTRRTAEVIADEMETLGATLDVEVGAESTIIDTETLRHTADAALDVLADVAQHPRLATHEVERARAARLSDLVQLQSEPRITAQKVFRQIVFGEHPYAHISLGTRRSVEALASKQLQAQHEAIFRPANAALIFVGDIDEARAHALAKAHFGSWQSRNTNGSNAPEQPAATAAELTLVDRPDSPQAQCLVGSLGVARSSPDYYALTLSNAILGGLFNSRINMNLREDKGWTYGARSGFTFLRSKGLFSIASGVRTDVAPAAIAEIFNEVQTMRTSAVSAEELLAAKNRYSLSIAGTMQTVAALTGQIAELYVYDLPLDYWQHFAAAIDAVSVADVQRMAQTYWLPEQMSVVLVGDKAKLEQGLVDLRRGELHLRDTEGRLLPASSLPPSP